MSKTRYVGFFEWLRGLAAVWLIRDRSRASSPGFYCWRIGGYVDGSKPCPECGAPSGHTEAPT